MAEQIPLVDYLVLGDDPHLVAHECTNCAARFFDRRNACAHCGQTDFKSVDIATDEPRSIVPWTVSSAICVQVPARSLKTYAAP